MTTVITTPNSKRPNDSTSSPLSIFSDIPIRQLAIAQKSLMYSAALNTNVQNTPNTSKISRNTDINSANSLNSIDSGPFNGDHQQYSSVKTSSQDAVCYVYKSELDSLSQTMLEMSKKQEMSKKLDYVNQGIVALKTLVNSPVAGGSAAIANQREPQPVEPPFQFFRCKNKEELIHFENQLLIDTAFRAKVRTYLTTFFSAGSMAKQAHTVVMRLLPLLIDSKV